MKIPQIPRVKTTQELLLEAEKERLTSVIIASCRWKGIYF